MEENEVEMMCLFSDNFIGTSSINGDLRRWSSRVCSGKEEMNRLEVVHIQVGFEME